MSEERTPDCPKKDTWWFYYSTKSSSVKTSSGDNFQAEKKEFTIHLVT